MKEEEILELIEKISANYINALNSREYRLGKKMLSVFNKIKSGRVIAAFKEIYVYFRMKRFSINTKTVVNIDNKPIKNKKIVIYTCIVGNYDKVVDPVFVNKNCDYILFTDNKSITSKVWTIKIIPQDILRRFSDNGAIINRYYKLNPKLFFEEYDYSIYIDGSVNLISDASPLINNINKVVGIAMHIHSSRNCIYEEYKVCKLLKKGNLKAIQSQIKRYENEGFPQRYGMLECGALVTDLKNKKALKIYQEWWQEFYTSESFRDQLSLPYILWKLKITIKSVGTLGNNIYENPKFFINRH